MKSEVKENPYSIGGKTKSGAEIIANGRSGHRLGEFESRYLNTLAVNSAQASAAPSADENDFSFLSTPEGREWEETGGKLGYGMSGRIGNPPTRSLIGDAYRISMREAANSKNSLGTRAGYGMSALVMAIPGALNDAASGVLNSPYNMYAGTKTMQAGLAADNPYMTADGLMQASVGLLDAAGAASLLKIGVSSYRSANNYSISNSSAASTYGANSSGSNIVYRALTPADAASIEAGTGLAAKAPSGTWTAA